MPFCPQCKTEYKQGVETCADCGVGLTAELEVELRESEERTVVAYEAQNEIEAQSVSHLLEQASIRHFIGATLAQSVYPMSIGKLARIQVRVLEHDLEAARELIASMKEEPGSEDNS